MPSFAGAGSCIDVTPYILCMLIGVGVMLTLTYQVSWFTDDLRECSAKMQQLEKNGMVGECIAFKPFLAVFIGIGVTLALIFEVLPALYRWYERRQEKVKA